MYPPARRAPPFALLLALAVAVVAATLGTAPVHAFKIDPWSYRPFGVSPRGIETQLESFLHNPRMLLLGPLSMGARLPAAMGQLKEPAHENLTELSIRCARAPLARGMLKAGTFAAAGMILGCAGRSGELQSHASDLGADNEDLIRAVRFNDAPPVKTARALMALVTPSALVCGEVRVPDNAGCWALLMAHAGGLAINDPGNREFGPAGNVLYRSHFGDMQFMHAMAARGDTLAQGRARILLWAKFAYQAASGEIAVNARIGTLPEFAGILTGFEAVTVSEFFDIRGNLAPARVRRLALGALLHTLQDSFAEGHSGRAQHEGHAFGPLIALRDYSCQSSEKHSAADRAAYYAWFGAATHGEKSPVTLGAQLIDLLAREIKWDAPIASVVPEASVSLTAGSAERALSQPETAAVFDAAALPVGSTGTGSVAEFVREAIFPVVIANAHLTSSAGAGFLRAGNMQASAHSGTGLITPANDTATTLIGQDCKE